jgi:tetratricopeptide (TPR) repeat protein
MMKIITIILGILLSCVILAACSSPPTVEVTSTTLTPDSKAATITATPTAVTPTYTVTPIPSKTPTAVPTPTQTASLADRELSLVTRVNAIMSIGQVESAIDLCSEAIRVDPTFAMAYTIRGLIYLGNLDLEAAVQDFDKAVESGILDDPDKEIDEGMTVKTIYYFRGKANMGLGAYKQGINDLEQFLNITEPLEYPQLRQNAQYHLATWQMEGQPVISGQQFDKELYSIRAPEGEGWKLDLPGPETLSFGHQEDLDSSFGDGLYGERTFAAISSVIVLEVDYSDEDFYEYACSSMGEVNERYKPLQTFCERVEKPNYSCARLAADYEDYGSKDIPTDPPLILSGFSLSCRHPDDRKVTIYLHYSQRGPLGSLDEDIEKQAEAFFSGLSIKQLEE